MSQDPVGLFGGINTYQYAPNPAGWIDPLGLSTSSDAEILAKNLTDCGSARPSSRHKAHHIVMSNSNDPKMKALREKMGKNGLDIDVSDARNGVWLPETTGDRLPGSTKTAHKGEGVHGQDYKNKVYQKLIGAKNQDEFYKGLAELKSDLEGGWRTAAQGRESLPRQAPVGFGLSAALESGRVSVVCDAGPVAADRRLRFGGDPVRSRRG